MRHLERVGRIEPWGCCVRTHRVSVIGLIVQCPYDWRHRQQDRADASYYRDDDRSLDRVLRHQMPRARASPESNLQDSEEEALEADDQKEQNHDNYELVDGEVEDRFETSLPEDEDDNESEGNKHHRLHRVQGDLDAPYPAQSYRILEDL